MMMPIMRSLLALVRERTLQRYDVWRQEYHVKLEMRGNSKLEGGINTRVSVPAQNINQIKQDQPWYPKNLTIK